MAPCQCQPWLAKHWMISCMSQKRNTLLFKDELDETCQGFVSFQWYLTTAIGNRHVPCHTQNMIKHMQMDSKQVKEFSGIFQILIKKNFKKTGEVVVQEALSMLPACALDVRPGHRALDLCSAPGPASCWTPCRGSPLPPWWPMTCCWNVRNGSKIGPNGKGAGNSW